MKGLCILVLPVVWFSVSAGPGIQETLVLSPDGFSSLDLLLFWSGDPLSLAFGGRWGREGFARGTVESALTFDPIGLSAGFGVEPGGAWEARLGGSLSWRSFSFLGELSFAGAGFSGIKLGATFSQEPILLQGSVAWNDELSATLTLALTFNLFSLEVGGNFSPAGITQAMGRLLILGDQGRVGLGLDLHPTTNDRFLSTELDWHGEHISLEFTAVWDISPPGELQPAALSNSGGEKQGLWRFLKELRVEASAGVPLEGGAPGAETKKPVAIIAAPRTTTFLVGQKIVFSAQGSHSPSGWLEEVLWDFGDGAQARGMEVFHAYSGPGVYRVKLSVRDRLGNVAKAEHVLHIVPRRLIADFLWEPAQPTILDEVRFRDLSEGEIVSWHWEFGDGESSAEREPTHRYRRKGPFSVTLTVTDAYGNSASKTKEIVVVNLPPVADPGGPYRGALYQEITLSAAKSYDPDGRIVRYAWDFGDGGKGEGMNVVHVFRKPGTYRVCLVVTDDDGAQAQACTTAEITIYPTRGG